MKTITLKEQSTIFSLALAFFDCLVKLKLQGSAYLEFIALVAASNISLMPEEISTKHQRVIKRALRYAIKKFQKHINQLRKKGLSTDMFYLMLEITTADEVMIKKDNSSLTYRPVASLLRELLAYSDKLETIKSNYIQEVYLASDAGSCIFNDRKIIRSLLRKKIEKNHREFEKVILHAPAIPY
jgi:hypothetical protein